MRYVFSLHVFKQIGAHILLNCEPKSPAFIHYFKHSIAVKLCLQILIDPKSYGLEHDVFQEKMMHCFKVIILTAVPSFPNNLTNVIIYPKTRFFFVRLVWYFAQIIIIIIIINNAFH